MKTDPLTVALLGWADSRSAWWLLGRRPAARQERMPGWFILALGACGCLLAGLPVLVLGRAWSGTWSFWAFWVPGSAGLFAGLLGGTMIWLAWNRRAMAMKSLEQAGKGPVAAEPQRPPFRWLTQAILLLLILGAGVWLAAGLENWRGARALRAFRMELKARGEPVSIEEVIPPAIPDDRNLALAPPFRPLLQYRRVPKAPGASPWSASVEWLDSNGLARIQSVRLDAASESYRAFASNHGRPEKTWLEGAPEDLAMRQAYYVSLPDWAPAVASDSPAKDVLTALSRYDDLLNEIRKAAATHPETRFPIKYEEGFATMLSHLSPTKALSRVLSLRATALLAEGRADEAMADIELTLRLSDGLTGEPLLIIALVRYAIDALALQPIWEGCLAHQFSEAQLVRLQDAFKGRDYLGEFRRALQGERLCVDLAYEGLLRRDGLQLESLGFAENGDDVEDLVKALMLRLMNRGWIRQNQVANGRYIEAMVGDLRRARTHTDLPDQDFRLLDLQRNRSVYTMVAAKLAPALGSALDRGFEWEAERRLAVMGLGLERYRIANGHYPEALADLAPRWAPPEAAVDPMTGADLQYRRTEDDGYRLYSVGLDHVDSGGKRRERRATSSADRRKDSDLVWR